MMGKASRIKRERKAAHLREVAEMPVVLGLLELREFGDFESVIVEHPELLNQATQEALASLGDAPEFGASFRSFAALLADPSSESWVTFRRLADERESLAVDLDREADEINEMLLRGEASSALPRIDIAITAGTEAGLALSVGALRGLRGRALTQGTSTDRSQLMKAAIAEFETALLLTSEPAQAAELQMLIGLAEAQDPEGDTHESVGGAIARMRRTLDAVDATTSPGTVALIQTNLASALLRHGGPDHLSELEEARSLSEDALRYRSPELNPRDWAFTQLNFGAAVEQLPSAERSDLEQAIRSYEAVLAQERAVDERWLMGYTNFSLGRLYLGLSDENLEILDSHPRLSRLVESGEALVIAGRYLELAVRDSAVAPERIHHGRALAALARVREKLEDLAGATIAVREALEILTIDSEPIGCAHAAQQLGWLKAQEQDWDGSAAAYRAAVAATDLVFYARLETTSREADIRTAGNVYRWAAFAIAKAGALHEALLVLEGGRTREFRRRYGLTSVDHDLLGALPPALRDEYLASAHATASAPFGAPAAAPARRLQETLTSIRQWTGIETFATGATDDDIRGAVEPGWPIVYVNPTPFGTMVALVEQRDEALVEHQDLLLSPTSTAVFTRIGMGGEHEWPDETIDPSRAFMFAAASDHPISVDLHRALAHTLPWVGQQIAVPIAKLLTASKATGATLILSGPLAAVPLHAAPLDETGRCLLDDFDLRYAPSAVSLVASLSRPHEDGASPLRLVALADPERETQGRALPAAEPEAREIARAFPEAFTRIAVGRDANSSFFREHAGQAEYLHLACHAGGGMFDLNNGGIALADRIVRPLELTELTPLNARLAVASACQTAQAEILGQPDEVLSIGAILLAAGSACAVATQWSVNDAATAILMTRFYEVMIGEQLRPPEALRAAQLWLRELTNDAEAKYLSEHPALAADISERRARGEAIGEPPDQADDHRYASPTFWAPFVALGA